MDLFSDWKRGTGGAGSGGVGTVLAETCTLETCGKNTANKDAELESVPTGVVRLLQTTKIPAGYGKMVRSRVDGEIEAALFLFIPSALGRGVELADGVVEVGEGPCVMLVVENHGREMLRLKRGVQLGSVTAAEIAPGQGGAKVDVLETACVCRLATSKDCKQPDKAAI